MRPPGRIRKSTRMHMKSPKIPRFFWMHPVFEHARGPRPALPCAKRRRKPDGSRSRSERHTDGVPSAVRQCRPAPTSENSTRTTGQRPDQYFPRHNAAMRSAMRASVEFEVFGS